MRRFLRMTTYLLTLLLIISVSACVRYNLEIQNKTDEVLDLYIDGYYEGSLAPNNYLFIRNLSMGAHSVEALDLKGKLVAESEIYLDQDSKWIIYN